MIKRSRVTGRFLKTKKATTKRKVKRNPKKKGVSFEGPIFRWDGRAFGHGSKSVVDSLFKPVGKRTLDGYYHKMANGDLKIYNLQGKQIATACYD